MKCKQKFLVTYDISDDKKRGRVSNILSKFGERVQYSCFEIECSENELKELLNCLESIIDDSTDSIFFFPITKNMEKNIVEIGVKKGRRLLI
jgi:CRISPR-associated protein Cas2